MPDKPALRIAINFNRLPRSILTVIEKKKGALRIILKPSKYVRPESTSTLISGEHLDQGISVHRTDDDPSGNQIHYTPKWTLPTKPRETHHFTKAIKQNNQFAPLFLSRVANLSSDEYKITGGARHLISLGDIDANLFTLFFMVFIGPADRGFANDGSLSDTNILQHRFTLFNLVLVWSFLSIPSTDTGESVHLVTTKFTESLSESEKEFMRELAEGVDEVAGLALWDMFRDSRADAYRDLLKASSGPFKSIAAFDLARFFSKGQVSSEHLDWWFDFIRHTR